MLALELKKTVGELLATIDSDELTYWLAYYRISPFGDVRRDLQSGLVASVVANIHRSESHPGYSPADFLLYAEEPEPDPDELERKIKTAFGSLVKKTV